MRTARAAALAVALLAAMGAAGAVAAPRRVARPHPPVAQLTVSRSRTMLGETHLWDFAAALFVDSTRGVPEAGYWRVPAGTVQLRSDADTVTLTATPDIVNGVAYFAPQGAVRYREGATYTMTASGSDTVGAFAVQVTAPSQPHVTAPRMDDTLQRGVDVTVTWGPGAPGDSVRIDVMPHSPQGTPRLHYRTSDDGHFTIPARQLAACPSHYPTMITVTRERRAPVEATGLRGGWFVASASDYTHVFFAAPAAKPRRAPRR